MREQNYSKAQRMMLDDGLPAACIRIETPETKARLERIRREASRAPETITTPPTDAPKLTLEQQIEAEVDRRWRNWLPTATDRHRPNRRSLRKQVRTELMPKTEDTSMKKPKTKKATAPKKATKSKTPSRAKPATETAGKSKTAIAADLIRRSGGCTAREILDATGWTAVSVPALAESAGIKLQKKKVDGKTVYTAA